MPGSPTSLDKLVALAVDVERQIAALPRLPKLSAKAWVAAAMKNAKADAKRLDAIEALFSRPGGDRLGGFVRTLRRMVVEVPNYGVPPDDGVRLLHAYGREGLHATLNEFGVTALELLALAARISAEMHPNVFGEVQHMSRHAEKVSALHDRRHALRAEMLSALTAADVEFDQESLVATERDKGLAYVRFRRWPDVVFARDWPARIVAAEMAKPLAEIEAA